MLSIHEDDAASVRSDGWSNGVLPHRRETGQRAFLIASMRRPYPAI